MTYDLKDMPPLTPTHSAFIESPAKRKILIGSSACGTSVACYQAVYSAKLNAYWLGSGSAHKDKFLRKYAASHIPLHTVPDANCLLADTNLQSRVGGLLAACEAFTQTIAGADYRVLPYLPQLLAAGFELHILPPMTEETAKHLPPGHIANIKAVRGKGPALYALTGVVADDQINR